LGDLVTVSAKISEETRKKMRDLGIAPSEVIKQAIKEEIERRELELLHERLRDMESTSRKLSVERGVESIREDRNVG
jgi:hypothetical protein